MFEKEIKEIKSQEEFVNFVRNIECEGEIYGCRAPCPPDTGFWDPRALEGCFEKGVECMAEVAEWWYRATSAAYLGLIPEDADSGDYDQYYKG